LRNKKAVNRCDGLAGSNARQRLDQTVVPRGISTAVRDALVEAGASLAGHQPRARLSSGPVFRLSSLRCSRHVHEA
jgi:hypothetical protein